MSLRRVLFPVALAALVVAVIVAAAGAVVSQRISESEAVHDVAELTDDLADSQLSLLSSPGGGTRIRYQVSEP